MPGDEKPQESVGLPTGSSHFAYALGAVTCAGGVMGFVKAGSARSLVAGTLLSGGFFWAGSCISSDQQLRGFRFATAISVILTGAMGARFLKTRRVVPNGLLAVAGLAGTAYHGSKWQEWER